MTAQDLIIKRVSMVSELEILLKEFKGKNLDDALFKAAVDKVRAKFSGDLNEFIVIEHIFGRLR